MKAISNVREFTNNIDHKKIEELISDEEIPQKRKVLEYLKSFDPDCAAGMLIQDEVIGKAVNACVEGYEDGQYFWDSRYIYHFEKYNLKLSEDFIKHVLRT